MSVFGGDFTRNMSPLQQLIARAVDPYKLEPDFAAHLEVAECINKKKANTPREAAMAIARIVNNRNPHISLLALSLLETLVAQCGYPFHLQIATKEFLNEIVRRFPERPPPFPGPVMTKILELIKTWTQTICVESRWKEDLGNIRDMYRLLTFKGYRFRDVQTATAAAHGAVASTSNLKTAEELEEEDREAQQAKLQELIRRGTPRDLAAAQELMKVLAGAEPEKKPDYRAQALTELNKLEQKVILLNEMLDNVDVERGERFASGDAYDQVSGILSAARPKIQKWISDAESGDPEMLDIFLQMNDQINSVLNRYEAFKKGDYSTAKNPIPAELANTSRTQDSSLIDLDDSAAGGVSNNPTDDLADIFGPPTATASVPSTSSLPPFLQQQQQRAQSQPVGVPMAHPSPSVAPNGAGQSQGYNQNQDALAALFNSTPSPTPSQGGKGAAGVGSISLPWTPGPQTQPQTQTHAQAQTATTASIVQQPRQPQGSFWSLQTGASSSSGVQPSSGLSLSQQRLQQQQPGLGPSMASILVSNGSSATTSPATATNTNTSAGPSAATSSGTTTAQGKDPFADLAGLF